MTSLFNSGFFSSFGFDEDVDGFFGFFKENNERTSLIVMSGFSSHFSDDQKVFDGLSWLFNIRFHWSCLDFDGRMIFFFVGVGCWGIVGSDEGIPGTEGTPGIEGTPGTEGIPGTEGTPGTGGTLGIEGTAGTFGTEGTPGTEGIGIAPGTGGTDTFGMGGTFVTESF